MAGNGVRVKFPVQLPQRIEWADGKFTLTPLPRPTPAMLRRMRLARLLACSLLAGCASTPTPDTAVATFVVVRHAEKVDASRDPDLAPAGHARAVALAGLFADRLRPAYGPRADRLAMLILAALEGGIILARTERSEQPLLDVADEIAMLLGEGD